MAVLRIIDENRTLTDSAVIAECLAARGIDYERWPVDDRVAAGAPADDVLNAYRSEIDALKARGGYVTADVIDVTPETPGLETMLAKFSREHWHDEDEVRFIIAGNGVFHLHTPDGPVVAIEVGSGDMIRVPRGTLHWFDLCADRRIRAIRLFQDVSGWTPHYTDSGEETKFLPVCFGAGYLRPHTRTEI
ncbi:MAG: cupin domain-containing protein [Pyrinomonadaceae bacterium]|nr:cupin domain-containing protein [Pyrinomonadaceae bacterium]